MIWNHYYFCIMNLYEQIVRGLTDISLYVDRNYVFTDVSGIEENDEKIPFLKQNYIGRHVRDVLSDDNSADIIEKTIDETFATKQVHITEYARSGDTRVHYYRARFIWITDSRLFMVVSDISQYKDFSNQIIDNCPFPMLIKDASRDFRYVYVNKEATRQSLIPAKEMLGKNDIEIYGDMLGKKHIAQDIHVMDTGETMKLVDDYTTPDGILHHTIVVKNKLYANHPYLQVMRWDISDEVKMKKKVDYLMRINDIVLDNVQSGFAFISEDYMVLWENVERCEIPVSAYYKTGEYCYHSRGFNAPCSDCVFLGAAKDEVCTKVIYERGRYVEIVSSPVCENGKYIGRVLKMTDVTENVKLNEELKAAKERAVHADVMKSAFLANMSHEIRNPLNSILGFSQLLAYTDDVTEKEEYNGIIKRDSDLLLQLINDILDLSKLEAGTLDFNYKDIDVRSMFHDMETAFKVRLPKASEVEIIFETSDIPLILNTDKVRLQQVIVNFMTNAIKFTSTGSIRFGYIPDQAKNEIRFYLTDTGKGIPADKTDAIFDRFVKLDQRGSGLGLSISKMIVKKFGGEIGVTSKEGVGSTFWFTVPVK